MEWIIVWLALCIVAGVWASQKGRSGFGYFLLAFLLSPLVGLIAAGIASPRARAAAPACGGLYRKWCPACSKHALTEDAYCRHCGAALQIQGDTGIKQPATD